VKELKSVNGVKRGNIGSTYDSLYMTVTRRLTPRKYKYAVVTFKYLNQVPRHPISNAQCFEFDVEEFQASAGYRRE